MSTEAKSIANWVIDLIIDDIGCTREDLKPDTQFIDDLGCDSLDMFGLLLKFEELCDIDITDEEAEAVLTVADAIALAERKAVRP